MPCVLPNHYTIIRLLTIAPQWRLASTTMAEKAKAVFYFIIVFYKIQYNQHTGLASGTLAGAQTDEEGNVIGFDPLKKPYHKHSKQDKHLRIHACSKTLAQRFFRINIFIITKFD